ncbi:hypothetical protein BST14_09940 [Mycobacterium arosiense ATCC BAA-1401 = DSM 45069]|uniref:Uncharacterized protein n=1 Tax=Mycobacterium arosiense ATCC BAA-1401 = DSM 45069 TaxID=1265311 RepID=A0A1W9ZK65_MYCAI|nr:hypothetical protein BST14_09940 [Mycobacterium arosiense ATCC BAA-1401 = DSM 45069]
MESPDIPGRFTTAAAVSNGNLRDAPSIPHRKTIRHRRPPGPRPFCTPRGALIITPRICDEIGY